MAVFISILEDHVLPLIVTLVTSARETSFPMEYLNKHKGMYCTYMYIRILHGHFVYSTLSYLEIEKGENGIYSTHTLKHNYNSNQ